MEGKEKDGKRLSNYIFLKTSYV